MGHSEVKEIIEKSKRPLLMRCQIGVLSSDMAPLAINLSAEPTPLPDSVDNETPKGEGELENSSPWSPVLPVPCDEDCSKIHRHYNFITSKEQTLTYENEVGLE